MVEKRKLARMHVLSYICVNESESEEPIGQIKDISTSGMRLYGDTPLELFTRYQFKMRLPRQGEEAVNNNSDREVRFDADVVWCKKDKIFNTYDAGIQLTEISETDRKAIEEFMQNATFDERWLDGQRLIKQEY